MAITQVGHYCTVTLAAKDGTGTTTYNLSTKEIYHASTKYYPILANISDVGSRMGEYLPQVIGGSITIDNRASSFGYERRFSDLFERYTPVDQTIALYSFEQSIPTTTTESFTATPFLVFTGRVRDWRIDGEQQVLILTIESRTLDNIVMTRQVDSTLTTDTKGQGKYLPIVFGNAVEVKPILIDSGLAYATDIGSSYQVGGILQIYAKDDESNYVEIDSASAVGTAVIDLYTGSTSTSTFSSTTNEIASPIFGAYGRIITQISVGFTGTAGYVGTPKGKIIYTVYETTSIDGKPTDTILWTGEVDKEDYTSELTSASAFVIYIQLEKPLILSVGRTYKIGVCETITDAALTYAAKLQTSDPGSAYLRYIRHVQDASTTFPATTPWFGLSTTYYSMNAKFYGVKFTDTHGSVDANYLGYAYAALTQNTTVGGYDATDLTKLDCVFTIEGLNDDGSGTVTGSASSVITNPVFALSLLSMEPGSPWATPTLDVSLFNGSHGALASSHQFYRALSGATEGRQSRTTIMGSIARDTATRVALVNGASLLLGAWSWGTYTASERTIDDERCRVLRVEGRGLETVVNYITLNYSRQIRNDVNPGEFQTYGYASFGGQHNKDYDPIAYANLITISATSETLFGKKDPILADYKWLGSLASANALVYYISSVFALPHTFVTFELPLFDYYDLELMDVVTLVHPDLPSHFGTSSNAKLPTIDGTEELITEGYYFKRAKPYRVQIESRTINFNLGGFPTVTLEARLLDNYPDDPT